MLINVVAVLLKQVPLIVAVVAVSVVSAVAIAPPTLGGTSSPPPQNRLRPSLEPVRVLHKTSHVYHIS